jgi:hypothetical protein
MTLDEVISRFQNVRKAGNGYSCKCPSHDDKKNSLSAGKTDEKILIKCHAGCATESILSAVGLKLNDLYITNGNGRGKDHDPVTARYIYTDETGAPLFRICRTASKDFFAERFVNGTFINGMKDIRRVLYRLPAVVQSRTVIVVEGEKAVESVEKIGLIATTSPFGAGKWSDEYVLSFKGKRVAILPDNDSPGRAHAWQVAKSIISVTDMVKLVELPGLPDKGDVSDFLKAHPTKDDLLKVIHETKPLTVEDVNSHSNGEQQKSKAAWGNCWSRAKDAPTFLAEVDKEISGLAKDLINPGTITLMAAPRGLGKSLVALSVSVTIARGGTFRGENVAPMRVFLVDRDNPKRTVKERLRSFGASEAPRLKVIPREDAPDLQDKNAWEAFPVNDYEVIVIDSLGSFTEGVTEKEGKETTKILATVLDLIHRGPAVLLLANCTKDAFSVKGRGEWMDRVDIIYEVRDATAFTPSGKKDWWQELPEAGESAWADRAARRKNRIDYRLAFVPSKFRLGAQPDPFCLELRLPKDEPWTLEDVTEEIIRAGEDVIKEAARKKEQQEQEAVKALAEVVKERYAAGNPILKTAAENYLNKEMEISQKRSRELIKANDGTLWTLQDVGGQGSGKGLFPPRVTPGNDKKASEGKSAVAQAQSGPQKSDPSNQLTDKDFSDTPFLSLEPVSTPDPDRDNSQKDPWESGGNG